MVRPVKILYPERPVKPEPPADYIFKSLDNLKIEGGYGSLTAGQIRISD